MDTNQNIEKIILQKQIEILKSHIEHPNKPGYKRSDVVGSIKRLKKELEKLEKINK